MSLFKSNRDIETKIDGFFDTIGEGGLVYREGIRAYLDGSTADFENALVGIDKLESKADKLSLEVESHLYSHSLIPDHRGDVLGSILDRSGRDGRPNRRGQQRHSHAHCLPICSGTVTATIAIHDETGLPYPWQHLVGASGTYPGDLHIDAGSQGPCKGCLLGGSSSQTGVPIAFCVLDLLDVVPVVACPRY